MPTFITFNIYLFYGLVFFSIGCVVVFRNFKYSQLKIAPTLWALALFGFSHAFHEWSELYLLEFSDDIPGKFHLMAEWLRLLKLFLSYSFLMVFAWLLFGIGSKWVARVGRSVVIATLLAYLGTVIYFSHAIYLAEDTFREATFYTRLFLGFGSAFLAATGIALYGYKLMQEQHKYGSYFIATGVGLLCYGVMSGLVPTDLHHSIPVFRTLAGALILFALFKALKVFDIEKELATEAKLKRAIEADKYKAIGHLAMGMAHEINNPLASSTLALDIFQRKSPDLDEQQLKYIERISLGIERASEISKELLAYARPAKGNTSLVPVSEVISASIHLLSHKHHSHRINIDCEEDITMMGQKVKLEELLINLLTNAMDASQSGSEIAITAGECDRYVRLTVEDWGAGMDSESLSRATELFYSTKPIGQGTGLGLAICEQIVALHRGVLNIASELGQGTKIEMHFPKPEFFEKDQL
ncbi:sensor histidine kinase [Shewanella atlantica]|uniref:histidine kinase n=1 Tax=Shewanella atlantica TaxID=271099 RepID=A0A431VSS9_9GAMM|nr:HAMP domain-containing sensor histidine kinase [Shewanella atlantica]RTR26194.1 histidine kinase [Shewanella atlantica]